MFPTQTPFLWKRAFPSRVFLSVNNLSSAIQKNGIISSMLRILGYKRAEWPEDHVSKSQRGGQVWCTKVHWCLFSLTQGRDWSPETSVRKRPQALRLWWLPPQPWYLPLHRHWTLQIRYLGFLEERLERCERSRAAKEAVERPHRNMPSLWGEEVSSGAGTLWPRHVPGLPKRADVEAECEVSLLPATCSLRDWRFVFGLNLALR